MSEHTKGPWEAVETGSGMLRRCFIKEPTGNVVATCSLLNDDARLIAAAPEMLEALKNIENDDERIPSSAWNLVRSAIAKATGKEQE